MKKTRGLGSFTGKFYQIFKAGIYYSYTYSLRN